MFFSILFPGEVSPGVTAAEPACFRDLNLDLVFAPILDDGRFAPLAPYFYTPLQDQEAIRYRQQIGRDIARPPVCKALDAFAMALTAADAGLSRANAAMHDEPDSWLALGSMLDCGRRYCQAVTRLQKALAGLPLASQGLLAFRDYLDTVLASADFQSLSRTAETLHARFDTLDYCMLLKNGSVHLRKYQGEADLSREIADTFARFHTGPQATPADAPPQKPFSAQVEAQILHCLARLYPQEFQALQEAAPLLSHCIDPVLLRFSREIFFYLAWQAQLSPLQDAGLSFCWPDMGLHPAHTFCSGFFDLALARRCPAQVVANDFTQNLPERLFVVTGPNQGGKTTFARAFGQLHYLACLGLAVPGKAAALAVTDRIFTHFEREENLALQSGKLQDDLQRLRDILQSATGSSLVIINEIFASTTTQDAQLLGTRMMDALAQTGCRGVIVTFLQALAAHGPETVSLMSTVSPQNPAVRTFRILRKPPDGQAWANTLALKHGLTYDQIVRRLSQ